MTFKWQEICQLFIQKSALHVKAQKTGDKIFVRIGRIPRHGRCAPTPVVIITEIKERVAKTLFITFNFSLTEKKHSQRKKRNDDIERDIF